MVDQRKFTTELLIAFKSLCDRLPWQAPRQRIALGVAVVAEAGIEIKDYKHTVRSPLFGEIGSAFQEMIEKGWIEKHSVKDDFKRDLYFEYREPIMKICGGFYSDVEQMKKILSKDWPLGDHWFKLTSKGEEVAVKLSQGLPIYTEDEGYFPEVPVYEADWNDDRLELKILETYIDHYEQVKTDIEQGHRPDKKCEKELDIGQVIQAITGWQPPKLDRSKERWFNQLVSRYQGIRKPLRGCSASQLKQGAHHWHARAYYDEKGAPAWERVSELRRIVRLSIVPSKEFDQKFRILLSPGQAKRDFARWIVEGKKYGLEVAVVYVDIDNFKRLNETYTETKVDRTVLPAAMRLIKKLVHLRGEAYRQGGDEFVIILPNCDQEEAPRFAEKLRQAFCNQPFEIDGATEHITVSVGIGLWPVHGKIYEEVLQVSNNAKKRAKKFRNKCIVAGG